MLPLLPHAFAELPEAFYNRQAWESFEHPFVAFENLSLKQELGIQEVDGQELMKIFNGTEIGSRPLFFLGILLLLLGAQLISIGLIAEMITRQTTPETTRLVAERLN